MKTGTIIGLSVTGALLLAGGVAAMRLYSFQDNLNVEQNMETEVTKRILGVPVGFRLKVTPTLKNPSKTKVTLTQPYVELRLDQNSEAPLTSSEVVPKEHEILPFSQKTFDPIVLDIDLTKSISDVIGFAKNAIKEKKIGLYTKTVSVLNKSILIKKPDERVFKI